MPKNTTPHSGYDSYNLWEQVDEYVTRQQFRAYTGKNKRPSEASIRFRDPITGYEETHGSCLRAVYYRYKYPELGAETSGRTQQIFLMGNAIEDALCNIFKEMGIWHASSVRFREDEYGISGELDVVLKEPDGTIYGGEVKTAYGYYAEKEVIGNTKVAGGPKMSQLLQTLIYCWVFKGRLPYFRLIYMFRDSCARRTFKVELHEQDGKHYPKVDGVVDRRFTVEDILDRYKKTDEYVQNEKLPPRDYEYEYSDAKVEKLYSLGRLSKAKYEKHKAPRKPEPAGDWMCSYCSYLEVCNRDGDGEHLDQPTASQLSLLD